MRSLEVGDSRAVCIKYRRERHEHSWNQKIDHVGSTVPDLDEAVSFFRDHFGFETAYEFGPFASRRIGWKNGWQFKASCQPLQAHGYASREQIMLNAPSAC